jgi:hypothetical protein
MQTILKLNIITMIKNIILEILMKKLCYVLSLLVGILSKKKDIGGLLILFKDKIIQITV